MMFNNKLNGLEIVFDKDDSPELKRLVVTKFEGIVHLVQALECRCRK